MNRRDFLIDKLAERLGIRRKRGESRDHWHGRLTWALTADEREAICAALGIESTDDPVEAIHELRDGRHQLRQHAAEVEAERDALRAEVKRVTRIAQERGADRDSVVAEKHALECAVAITDEEHADRLAAAERSGPRPRRRPPSARAYLTGRGS